MRIQIRRNVFETNSSSTHSLTICEEKMYDGWVQGEYAFDKYKEEFIKVDITPQSLDEMSKEEEKEVKYNYLTMGDSYFAWDELDDNAKNEWYRDYQIKKEYGEQYCTYYVWEQSSYWLSNRGEICQKYLSPHGDELIVFGFYGYDG